MSIGRRHEIRSNRIRDASRKDPVDLHHCGAIDFPARDLGERIQLMGLTRAPQFDAAFRPVERPPQCQMNHAFVVVRLRKAVELGNSVEILMKAPPVFSQAPPTVTSLLLVFKVPWVMVMVEVAVMVSAMIQGPVPFKVTLLKGFPWEAMVCEPPEVKVTVASVVVKVPRVVRQLPATLISLPLPFNNPWESVTVEMTVMVSCRTQEPPTPLKVM